MRLDITAAEAHRYLRARGFAVHNPLDAVVGDDNARIALQGGHWAVVYRDEFGKLQVAVQTTLPPDERLTYHDLLTVHIELDKRLDTYRSLGRNPTNLDKAREYADAQNNLVHLLSKVKRLLHNERTAAYAKEAVEISLLP